MAVDRSLEAKRRELARLQNQLGRTGLVLQGTITERTLVRDTREKTGKTYGPYYQWTRKRKAKTVTTNLTKRQARAYQKAIDNHRRLERAVSRMLELSLEILEETTEGVRKRARRQ